MSRSTWIWGGATALWLVGLSVAFVALAEYKGAQGEVSHPAPASWPADVALERRAGEAKLLMFLHPECSCSRASLAELERLLVATEGLPLDVELVFVLPAGTPDSFATTQLWSQAAAIPGLTLSRDRDGVSAARFGAATSGHTLLYGADGALHFSGGVTASRGHEGPSAGGTRLAALLRGAEADGAESAIFGCALEDAAPTQPGTF